MELDGKLALEVQEICDEGDVLIEMGELEQAFENFSEAFSLIPAPRHEYTWALAKRSLSMTIPNTSHF